AQAREMAIARCAVGDDLGKRGLGLAVLAAIGQRAGGFEGRAGLGRLLGLEPLVAAPRRDSRDHEDGRDRDIDAVAIPQLLQLLAPDFLIDFLKDIGQRTVPTETQAHLKSGLAYRCGAGKAKMQPAPAFNPLMDRATLPLPAS